MLSNEIRRKIQNITSGTDIEGAADHCTTLRNLLCRRYSPSTTVKTDFESKSIAKKEQAELIGKYCDEYNLWLDLPHQHIAQGGESRVYLEPNNKDVIKANDGGYYATWLEFFTNILLHNCVFENTAYTLIGFHKKDNSLYAILRQPFVVSDRTVELIEIKEFLEYNGFINTKRQDYSFAELGLILEDMHDENVLLYNGLLFFIDTVFYTVTESKSE